MIFSFFERSLTSPWVNETVSMTAESIICVVAYVFAILFAISIHEYGHAFVAYKCGDMTAKFSGRMTINPFKHVDFMGGAMLLLVGFGWAKPVPVNFNNLNNQKRDTILVSLAGIILNIISAFILMLFYILLRTLIPADAFLDSSFLYLLVYMVYCFLWLSMLIHINLALFNILPLCPLDGFRVLESFCGYGNGFVEFLRRYSFIIFLVILVWSYMPFFSPFSWYIQNVGGLLLNLFDGFWGLILGLFGL